MSGCAIGNGARLERDEPGEGSVERLEQRADVARRRAGVVFLADAVGDDRARDPRGARGGGTERALAGMVRAAERPVGVLRVRPGVVDVAGPRVGREELAGHVGAERSLNAAAAGVVGERAAAPSEGAPRPRVHRVVSRRVAATGTAASVPVGPPAGAACAELVAARPLPARREPSGRALDARSTRLPADGAVRAGSSRFGRHATQPTDIQTDDGLRRNPRDR